ncbi:alpha/beta fold hydrolase [Jiangella asiatica]|uniref:Alpha/beta fold hydrolase n=1 Tax=Jiangella asiatica TaxID=2530372 RepID=A0A4R5CI32_9ACTN|nr:alpha/beta fold hydrolase [Jiangella asiatica]TDD98210.1 alpha/beta fold hydrolase [Jiangella asiatica]
MTTRSILAGRTIVTTPDGTSIAVHVSGAGRPLVLVPGTTSDHTSWRFVVPLLEPHATVHAVDRRGRGDSGDGPAYALEREFADVAAVVAAAAASAGTQVDLLGHSFGGEVACGAALSRSRHVRRLVLYEGWPAPRAEHRRLPDDVLRRVEGLLASGRPEDALRAFFRDMVLLSDDEVDTVAAGPTWPLRVAAAHTVPREVRAFASHIFDPAEAARLTMPVLLIVGGESPEAIRCDPDVVAAALPDATVRVLDGQGHMAHIADPAALAATVVTFLAD